jgi:hypothetical protein
LFGALHGFWEWRALQGMSVNKKNGLMKAKHLLSFSWCDEVCTTKGVLICQVISLDF